MTFQLAGDAAATYETVLVPLWFGRWAEALVDLVAPAPGERVLDIACGTGVTTRLARRRVEPEGAVVGLDVNASMLDTARDLAGKGDIRWLERDAADSGLETGSFDVVLSQHGYHYLPDKPAALREVRRVLRPGGRVAVSIWDGHSPYTAAVCAAVSAHLSEEAARTQRAQRETPPSADLALALEAAGFGDVEVVRQKLAIEVSPMAEFVPLHLGAMPIAGAFAALSARARARLVADVARAMEGHARNGRVVYPDAVHVATGRA